MIVFLNNKMLEENEAHISILDPGFLLGEGLFTTMRLYGGNAPLLEEHWLRLKQQADILQIPFTMPLAKLDGIITNLAMQNNPARGDSRCRITITRGGDPESVLPIIPNDEIQPTVLITVSPLPLAMDEKTRKGIAVITLGPEYLRPQSHLKSLSYLPSLLALRQARVQACDEAIIIDEQGNIAEGASSNVFIIKENILHTPTGNGPLLAGITRGIILGLAKSHQISLQEESMPRSLLNSADEVFLCNSIREIIPVVSIDNTPVASALPGPVTLNLAQWYKHSMRGMTQ